MIERQESILQQQDPLTLARAATSEAKKRAETPNIRARRKLNIYPDVEAYKHQIIKIRHKNIVNLQKQRNERHEQSAEKRLQMLNMLTTTYQTSVEAMSQSLLQQKIQNRRNFSILADQQALQQWFSQGT